MRALARLVVDDDPARAEGIDVDPVDLPGERDSAQVEPALQLGRGALGAERDLEAPRQERAVALRLGVHEGLQVTEQAVLELAPLQPGHLHPDAGEGVAETAPHEREGRVEVRGLDAVGADLLRQAGEEPEERLVRDPALQLRVDLGIDRLRVEQAVDEPRRGAVGEALELGHVEDGPPAELREDVRVA